MYSNIHGEQLASLNQKIVLIKRDIQERQSELKWFVDFDNERAHSDLCCLNRSLQEVRLRIDGLTKKVYSHNGNMDAYRSNAGGFLSFFWKTSEQVVAQRHADELEESLKPILQEKKEAESELVYQEKHKDQLESDLRRFKHIDPLGLESTLVGLTYELTRSQELAEQARIGSERWESIAGDLVRQLKSAQKELTDLQRRIDQAKKYKEQLTGATSKYEKAQIHELCTSVLGEGKPGKIIERLSGEHWTLTRTAEKLEERVCNVIRRLEAPIKTVIIDGNNLCNVPAQYGEDSFSIEPLKALVTYLETEYTVKLFFDPGIRTKLKINDDSLKAMFPTTTVTVMRGDAKADEAILGAAEFDKSAYVISNDRFKDFTKLSAVKERRVLTHIIHQSSVQILELNINIPY